MALRKGKGGECVSHGKKQRCAHKERPTLFHLCMRKAASTLPEVAHELQSLPDDLSIPLVREFLRRVPAPSVKELRAFCEAVSWVPQNLSLCGMPDVFSRRILQIIILPNVVRLDLRGCVWLENLDFLSALKCLECLNLQGCWRLKAQELLHIGEIRQLQCLDVENIPAVTDDFTPTLSGLTCLRALNVSGTFVGDGLMKVLTYGSRLRMWVSLEEGKRFKDPKLCTVIGRHEVQTLLNRHPASKLTCFRLQGTQISDATIACLQAMPDLLLLDVRQANKVTGRSLSSIRAKYRLIALPNNARLAARTNAMLAGVLRGECGCRAMARQGEVTDGFTALCQQAFYQLLHKPDFEWYETVDYSV